MNIESRALLAPVIALGLGAHSYGQCAVFSEIQKVDPPSNTAGDWLGYRVAFSGDVAAISALKDDEGITDCGSVHVYRFNGGGLEEEARLTASDPSQDDSFGVSMDVDVGGDVVVVGAHYSDSNGTDSGSAYVYHHNGTSWSQKQKLTAFDAAANDYYGTSCAVDGVYLAVGAAGSGPYGIGAVYIYTYNGSVWTYAQKIVPADGATLDNFGTSVDLDGGLLVIGAKNDDSLFDAAGAVYVYRLQGSTFVLEQQVFGSGLDGYDQFGVAVAVDGDRFIAGANVSDEFGSGSGSAYVFHHNGTSWVEEAKLFASDAEVGANFGDTVDLEGTRLVVGSPSKDSWCCWSQGSTYVYDRSGTTWSETTQLTASDGNYYDYMGSAALSNSIILAGARGEDQNGTDSGGAYLFSDVGLHMSITPGVATAGEQVTFQGSAGLAYSPCLLQIISVNEQPFYSIVTLGVMNNQGRWTFGGPIPAGITGVTIDFDFYGYNVCNQLVLANPSTLVIP